MILTLRQPPLSQLWLFPFYWEIQYLDIERNLMHLTDLWQLNMISILEWLQAKADVGGDLKQLHKQID